MERERTTLTSVGRAKCGLVQLGSHAAIYFFFFIKCPQKQSEIKWNNNVHVNMLSVGFDVALQ